MPSALQALREKHGITQDGLWDASGVTQSTISTLERSGRPPSLRIARQLADGLSRLSGQAYTVDDLFPPAPTGAREEA